jgi:hypothetical protein
MQYNDGLQEVLAEVTAPKDIRFDTAALEARHAKAQSVLMPLMPLVENENLSNSLRFLADLDARDIEQGVSLESLMPNVTDTLIAAARLSDKAMSVSYAVSDIILLKESASDVSDFIKDMGVALITHCLETPSEREANGEAASGQIGITADKNVTGFTIRVECTGRLSTKVINVNTLTDFKNLTAIISAAPVEGGMVIEARNIEFDEAVPDVLVLEESDILKRAII